MGARPAEHSVAARLLAREWRYIIVGQALVTLLMVPMLHVHATLTIAATAFNLLALANTIRVYRSRAAAAGQPHDNPGRDLATVAACIVGTARCAAALALWPR